MTHGLLTWPTGKTLRWCSKNDSQEAWGRIGVCTGTYLLSYVYPSVLLGPLFVNWKTVTRLMIFREPTDRRKLVHRLVNLLLERCSKTKDLQQVGTSVCKDMISRTLHRKNLHSRSKEDSCECSLERRQQFNFCLIRPKCRWLISVHFNKFQASIHTSLLLINYAYADLYGEGFYWSCLCLLKSLLAACPSEFL